MNFFLDPPGFGVSEAEESYQMRPGMFTSIGAEFFLLIC